MRAALASQDGKTTYASTTFMVNATSKAWELYNATLSPHETDTEGQAHNYIWGTQRLLPYLAYCMAFQRCWRGEPSKNRPEMHITLSAGPRRDTGGCSIPLSS